MSMTTTNVDLGSVEYKGMQFADGSLTFAAGGTMLAGTILARDNTTDAFVPFEVGGTTNDNGTPRAVLTYDVTADAAGDVAIRAGISGEVRLERLVVDADGDGSNVDAAVRDALRETSIVPVSVEQLGQYDNQPA